MDNQQNNVKEKQTFRQKLNYMLSRFGSYFNVKNDLESQSFVEQSIRSGVYMRGSQLLVLIFAIFIASLGLNTNSVPVIIGAMLISPLMGPIIGMGLALGIQDFTLLKAGLKNIGMAVLGSLVASAIYFLISPQYDGVGQLLARTSPSIYDVLIALFGGAAGFVSIACKNKGQVMPGVAIATSLMPPLCTAGYGLATWQMHYFLGALYLFLTNMIFILFATWIGVKILRYKSVVYQDLKRYKRVSTIVYSIVAVAILISIYLTVNMIRTSIFLDAARKFVDTEMVFPNTQVLNQNEYVKNGKRYIDVTLIGEALQKDSLQLVMLNKLDSVGLGGTMLNIKQGFSLTKADETDARDFNQFYKLMQQQLDARQNTIDSLKYIVKSGMSFSFESQKIAPEIKVLYPTVKDVAFSQMLASSVSGEVTDTVNMVFVNAPAGLTKSQRVQLASFIEVRFNRKNVNVAVNPQGFPWPVVKKQTESGNKPDGAAQKIKVTKK